MRKNKVVITALCFIAIGLIIASLGFFGFHGDFKALSTEEEKTTVYTPEGAYSKVIIEARADDVFIKPSSDGKTRIECTDDKEDSLTAEVKNGVLTVRKKAEKKSIKIDFSFIRNGITVYIPEKAYDELSIELSSGSIILGEDVTFKEQHLETDTGDITLLLPSDKLYAETETGKISVSDVALGEAELISDTGDIEIDTVAGSEHLIFKTDTGDVSVNDSSFSGISGETDTGEVLFQNTTAEEVISLRCNTGSVRFKDSDAGRLAVKTNTGDVSGNFLTPKIYMTYSDTGRIIVPFSTSGGECRIETNTGDIRFS